MIGGMVSSNAAVSDGFAITLNSGDTVRPGCYKLPETQGLEAAYALQDIAEGTVMGTTVFEARWNHKIPDGTGGQFTVSIGSITKARISGTFYGKLYLIGGTRSVKIRNGSFSLPFSYLTD